MCRDSWRKVKQPVFSRKDEVFGPGHASFTKSPDGKEDWIIYHAARHKGAGWDRNVRIQPFTWSSSGEPIFGDPVPEGHELPIPSGR
jgi:GH43 family beta-xylosidase